MSEIIYRAIGTIHSPYKDIKGMPIQPTGAVGIDGYLEVNPEYRDGLKDLEGFSHIILPYHFHLSKNYSLTVKPFLDKEERGLFSTRAPKRPNPIGISVVRLTGVKENRVNVKDMDILDGTPLLDIKPYVPEFDHRDVSSTGWLTSTGVDVSKTKADGRFG